MELSKIISFPDYQEFKTKFSEAKSHIVYTIVVYTFNILTLCVEVAINSGAKEN